MGNAQGGANKTVFQYCTLDRELRKSWAPEIFGQDHEEKFKQQEAAIEAFPLVKLSMKAFVEGEDEIVVGDILTCKLKVEYLNIGEGEKSGYVHSKHYPYLKRDNWFLIITDEAFTGLAAIEKLHVTGNTFEKEFKERVARTGKIAFTAILTNDSYKGMDQISKVEVNVVEVAQNRKKIEYLKEDLRAIKEANMVQAALMGEEEDTDEDEDDDVDEHTELMNKLKAAGLGPEGAKKVAAADEQD
jgi:hypothetical protein